jgi:hypothetical protein
MQVKSICAPSLLLRILETLDAKPRISRKAF